MAGRAKLMPPQEVIDELLRAKQERVTADASFHAAVVKAVRSGGSIRVVAELAGVTPLTIQHWLKKP